MTEPAFASGVFALPPGVDFPSALVKGLLTRFETASPEDLARVHLVVNTERMARRIRDLFDLGPPRLLPRISVLSEFAQKTLVTPLPPPASSLRRRLELARLIGALLDREPDLAARSSLFGLADSLAILMDEMQGEGVSVDAIRALDVSDMSGHWARAQQFLEITQDYLEAQGDTALDPQARQRLAVGNLIRHWRIESPDHPVIVAGSTGSRGTTAQLMIAVSQLPQGAVVLPGFDYDQPVSVWTDMRRAIQQKDHRHTNEDHPQFRFAKLIAMLDIAPRNIRPWTKDDPPSPPRNRLISLALRPAPVTDAWLREGPDLTDIGQATSDMTLVTAPDPRSEALAIALRLRKAAETGETAALITPDRMLTRQVSAALDRWNIMPDDSAGLPLQLSPPGRFLRHVAGLFTNPLAGDTLLTLLKHPLCHSGDERGAHLLHTRDLELHLRHYGPPFPTASDISTIGMELKNAPPPEWTGWLGRHFCDQDISGTRELSDWVCQLRHTAEAIAAGSATSGSGGLWDKNAGQNALSILTDLETNAQHGGPMTARDFADLLGALLAEGEVRDRDAPHDRIMIWGTLEARVQGADLVILGGLNEGVWPEAPDPDPWLNRAMRDDAGLLLPDRRIGLSAHDFQQAACAPKVWLTRSRRSTAAETVPSRWLNRLTNLLGGLPEQGGTQAVTDMEGRGNTWLDWATELDEAPRVDPASRPSPRPPVAARPRKLSVTEIKRLIRDPYAIYAKHVLRLRPLDNLVKIPDALLRGTAVHAVFEDFIDNSRENADRLTRDTFLTFSHDILSNTVPWHAARRLWFAKLDKIANAFLSAEHQRRAVARPLKFEALMQHSLAPLDFTITGRADRIDIDDGGRLFLYDYKTGAPPTQPQQAKFDKQLLISAAIAEQGGFEGLAPAPVAAAVFLGVSGSVRDVSAPLEDEPADKVLEDLRELISAYFESNQGYTARRMVQKDTDAGDYDQLARFGEWDRSDTPTPEDLT